MSTATEIFNAGFSMTDTPIGSASVSGEVLTGGSILFNNAVLFKVLNFELTNKPKTDFSCSFWVRPKNIVANIDCSLFIRFVNKVLSPSYKILTDISDASYIAFRVQNYGSYVYPTQWRNLKFYEVNVDVAHSNDQDYTHDPLESGAEEYISGSIDQWDHISISVRALSYTVYLNGVEFLVHDLFGASQYAIDAIQIFLNGNGNLDIGTSEIDLFDFRVYSRALDVTEVNALYSDIHGLVGNSLPLPME
jgi:hypothetical protein